MNREIKVVISDLDDVLLNNVLLSIWIAAKHILQRAKVHPLPGWVEFATTFDVPWHSFYRRFGINTDSAELYTLFHEVFPAEDKKRTRIDAGTHILLEYCQQHDIPIEIVTGSHLERAQHHLKEGGVDLSSIAAIHSEHQEKSPVIQKIIEKYGVDPRSVIYR